MEFVPYLPLNLLRAQGRVQALPSPQADNPPQNTEK
jgi:hypothetical protein